MTDQGSWMAREIASIPDIVARQAADVAPLTALAARLRRSQPQVVMTCARGSSGHAATFAKHVVERYLGTPVAAAAPSIASVYGGALRLRGQLVLAISQSGTSDDLVEFARQSRHAGALTVAITNDENSPLATVCDLALPIGAGPEHSVPATKTFVATLSLLMRLTAAWSGDASLDRAAGALPARLASATRLDWNAATNGLAAATNLITVGRGPTLAIAGEAALKLKETCGLHAEAFSGAEFLHGPIALLSPGDPVFLFMPSDAATRGMMDLAAVLRKKGANLLVAGLGPNVPGRLPVLAPEQPESDAICLIQSFYATAAQLASRRGFDVDRPRHLEKVTRTT
jgi:glutamine---fructose-6-phosphate transaminase (isomerizing)